MMSKELAEKVLNSYYQKIGSGAGEMLCVWTPTENELAEYVINIEAKTEQMRKDFRAIQESIRYIPTYHLSGEAKVFLQRMIDICEKYSTEPVR